MGRVPVALPSHIASRVRGAALVLLAGVLLGGCDASPSAGDRWCAGLCSAVRRCRFDAPNCEADCVADRPNLEDLSDALTDAEAPCLATLTCGALSGDEAAWRAQTDACWQEATMAVAATARSRAFCQSHARLWFDCGYSYTVEDCAQDYAVWSDAVLDRLAACETQPSCDLFDACEQRVEGS